MKEISVNTVINLLEKSNNKATGFLTTFMWLPLILAGIVLLSGTHILNNVFSAPVEHAGRVNLIIIIISCLLASPSIIFYILIKAKKRNQARKGQQIEIKVLDCIVFDKYLDKWHDNQTDPDVDRSRPHANYYIKFQSNNYKENGMFINHDISTTLSNYMNFKLDEKIYVITIDGKIYHNCIFSQNKYGLDKQLMGALEKPISYTY